MELHCTAFRQGEMIPLLYTCDGDDRLPELRWSSPPEGTRGFALLVEDPDAPHGTFTHWVRYDIPATIRELRPDQVVGLGGTNDFQTTGWRGPCPPSNHGDHRYFFRLYALDVPTLELRRGARADEVRQRMESHVLGTAEFMGRYRRTPR